MRRLNRLPNPSKLESLTSRPQTLIPLISPPSPNPRSVCSSHSPPNFFPSITNLFKDSERHRTYMARLHEEDFLNEVSELVDELVGSQSDPEQIADILESRRFFLCRKYPDGWALVETMQKLKALPLLALEIFDWRRKQAEDGLPMVAEEYAIGITIAGRIKNVDLAAMLFKEASMKGIKKSSTYNALLGVYMYNNLADKAQSLFREFKNETMCGPTIVTYNILLTVFGRLMLVDHMEETYREIKQSNLTPNLNTYNHLIAGYITAWTWEDMEKVYRILENSCIEPDNNTHMLMLRGYAHAGNLEKMERTYELIKQHVNENESSLLRAMICAYCKSSDRSRVAKVEALLKLIPEEEYRPWLNVLLIRLYAQELLMDGMETFISQAFEHNTSVTTVGIMRAIINTYFRCDALDRYTDFLKQAETSGWRICRSLYHCKMVMYSSANRVEEIENVLEEMKKFNLDPTKKTFWIMYKAYSERGQISRLEKLLGTMCKHGFGVPADAFSSQPSAYITQ